VPLLKREISFRRRPKRAAEAPAAGPAPRPEKVPLLKREIRLGGKRRREKEQATEAVVQQAVAEKVPLLKREIHLGRRPKRAREAPPEAVQAGTTAPVVEALLQAAAASPPAPEPAPSMPEPAAAPPAEPKVPLLKREIGFRRRPKEAAPATATPAAATTPWYKREISFRRRPKEAALATATPAAAPKPSATTPWYKRDISFGRSGGASPARPHRVRTKSIVGLKVGASGISAAHVVNDGRIELMQLVREPLARGVVVGGELREPDALADALRELFRRNRLPKRAVRLGVSNNRIGVRIIEIAGVMDPKQLHNAIRFRAQEVLPITLEDAVLDYQQLSQSVNAEGELVRRILLVVAYRDLIDRYVMAFKKAGVRLVGIDLEAFGLLRALAPPAAAGQRAEAAHVVVSIGHERSTFAVSDGNVCEFTRVLDWGGATLDVAIARQLNLSPSEAEPVKRALALDGSERPLPPGLTEEQMGLAADLVRRQLQTFARELVSSLQFYQNQAGSLGIGDIVISGGTAQLPGLAGELQRLIGVSVRVGDPFQRVEVSKRIAESDRSPALAVAIGLGIED
jgi:type IV pilus assembly protein PilM